MLQTGCDWKLEMAAVQVLCAVFIIGTLQWGITTEAAKTSVERRDVGRFGLSILCKSNYKVNPLRYNLYGCYCGFGGGGNPVDCVDQ